MACQRRLRSAGATAATFSPGVAEEGKAIQCRVTGRFGGGKHDGDQPPVPDCLAGAGDAAATGTGIARRPRRAPDRRKHRRQRAHLQSRHLDEKSRNIYLPWYRNGDPIGSPTTTAATMNEYTLTQADVATRAAFQCAVSGNNAGGSSTVISKFLPTDPKPIEPEAKDVGAITAVLGSSASSAFPRTNGGPQLEVCNANPPSTDVL